MRFEDGEVVNITRAKIPEPYRVSLVSGRRLTLDDLEDDVPPGYVAHGVVYNGQLYGPHALGALVEQTFLHIDWKAGGLMVLRGELSLLENIAPLSFNWKPTGDNEPIKFGSEPPTLF